MAVDTGHGATITFGTTSWTGSVVSIGGFESSRPAIDTSHLGTTNYRSKIPGDLADAGPFSCTVLWDPASATPAPSVVGAAETITVSWPISVTGNTVKAKYTASGFVTSVGTPELVTDQVQTGTFEITWATGPTWSAEAAS